MLHRVDISNFRTYVGKHIIGPFTNLSGITGPNGSGKSNITGAIDFLLSYRNIISVSTVYNSLKFNNTLEGNLAINNNKGSIGSNNNNCSFGNNNIYNDNVLGESMENEDIVVRIIIDSRILLNIFESNMKDESVCIEEYTVFYDKLYNDIKDAITNHNNNNNITDSSSNKSNISAFSNNIISDRQKKISEKYVDEILMLSEDLASLNKVGFIISKKENKCFINKFTTEAVFNILSSHKYTIFERVNDLLYINGMLFTPNIFAVVISLFNLNTAIFPILNPHTVDIEKNVDNLEKGSNEMKGSLNVEDDNKDLDNTLYKGITEEINKSNLDNILGDGIQADFNLINTDGKCQDNIDKNKGINNVIAATDVDKGTMQLNTIPSSEFVCALIEQISNTNLLKPEVKRLHKVYEKLNNECKTINQKRRYIVQDLKDAKENKVNMVKQKKLLQMRDNFVKEMYLNDLYNRVASIMRLDKDITDSKGMIKGIVYANIDQFIRFHPNNIDFSSENGIDVDVNKFLERINELRSKIEAEEDFSRLSSLSSQVFQEIHVKSKHNLLKLQKDNLLAEQMHEKTTTQYKLLDKCVLDNDRLKNEIKEILDETAKKINLINTKKKEKKQLFGEIECAEKLVEDYIKAISDNNFRSFLNQYNKNDSFNSVSNIGNTTINNRCSKFVLKRESEEDFRKFDALFINKASNLIDRLQEINLIIKPKLDKIKRIEKILSVKKDEMLKVNENDKNKINEVSERLNAKINDFKDEIRSMVLEITAKDIKKINIDLTDIDGHDFSEIDNDIDNSMNMKNNINLKKSTIINRYFKINKKIENKIDIYDRIKNDIILYDILIKKENKWNDLLSQSINQILLHRQFLKDSKTNLSLIDLIMFLKSKYNLIGRLIDLITPIQQKYEIPLSVIINNENLVICHNETQSLKCINYLKETKRGRLVFLPLNNVNNKSCFVDTTNLVQLFNEYKTNNIQFDRNITNITNYKNNRNDKKNFNLSNNNSNDNKNFNLSNNNLMII
ncbi:hypothetical protein EDEG_03153 [Edhazardia aedis USNM 41457]|uniref:SMC hinge domain-containing protein n=1 Tax=Edhazardia aedis (strain USNM 41457) TaxID=1003232 RepID=J9DIH5_EDHAE|nr:hypothetical protein EDEG_03153 [Edhazardia aedis USNM 41457]|eukprot:EJW02420.1 hypothetical protein EDEG_03153 [Edhazardia aedis USNM 41457]